ncbi:MAG: hypothetical protein U0R17_06160 [Acidimicrobiia bacterium]
MLKKLSAIFVLTIFMIILTSCSNSSSKTKTSDTKSKNSQLAKNKFSNSVDNVCLGVDKDVFIELSSSSNESTTDFPRFEKALQGAEDEMDKTIGKLDGIEIPDEQSDDFETFLDDLSAIRDSYPLLSEKFKELVAAMADSNSTDLEIQNKAQSDMEQLQSDIEPIIEDQTQRRNEIKKISKRLNFDNCDFIDVSSDY